MNSHSADGILEAHGAEAPSWTRVEGTLMSTARSVRRTYDKQLAALGINLAEASILAHLAGGQSLTQVELARRVGTGRARIGAHIDSLERKQAVQRTADAKDRRVWRVHLTPNGLDIWKASVGVDRSVREALRRDTTPAALEQLDSTLATINANANHVLAEDSIERTQGFGAVPRDRTA